jgi:hypothetical protein
LIRKDLIERFKEKLKKRVKMEKEALKKVLVEETYTVISVDLKDSLLMRLDLFIDREKMREFILQSAKEHRRCIVLPGPIDDVDYQVEYENNQEDIRTIHFEDEPGYKPMFDLFKVKDGEFIKEPDGNR